jgi:hypothetical protein
VPGCVPEILQMDALINRIYSGLGLHYGGGLDARLEDIIPYLAVRRQIKVNYVWAFLVTFADSRGNNRKTQGVK